MVLIVEASEAAEGSNKKHLGRMQRMTKTNL